MTNINFSLEVTGESPKELEVSLESSVISLNGLETKSVQFLIKNPLDRDVVFPQPVIAVSGEAAPKLHVQLRVPDIIIPPFETYEGYLEITSLQPIYSNEKAIINVTADDGII